MAETGWPLIPRELLPEPAAPAPARRRRPPAPPAGRQLSIFGAEAAAVSPADVAGLLIGPGRLTRMGGTARVAVPVDAAWRVHVLAAELVARGLVVTWRPRPEPPPADPADDTAAAGQPEPCDDDTAVAGQPEPREGAVGFEVLTAYSRRLNALARSWPAAADRLFLGGPRLRLWVAAAGRPRADGFALGLDPDGGWEVADAALARAGLAGTVVAGGREYLITGRRRLARLAELVGERPEPAPRGAWPGDEAA
jgi:hypothetical protein